MLRLKPYARVIMLAVLVIPASGKSSSSKETSSCPSGTRATAAACVLDADLVLTESIELGPFTKLDCRGHRILPAMAGSGTTAATYVPSFPALAIAITGGRGVVVRNCAIGADGARFDFGILALNSKDAGKSGHRIHNNEIHARDSAVTFLRVDDAIVNDNVITWTNGLGISFARDSDRNRVNNNVMSSPGAPLAAYRVAPGGPFGNDFDDAISLTSLHLQPLLNLVIGGKLYQFPNSEDGVYPSNEDNLIEGNHLSLPGPSAGKAHEGVLVATNATRSRVVGNTIAGAGTGIRLAGLMPAQPVTRPARCSEEPERFCLADADCFIPGVDAAPVGACPSPIAEVRDLRARDTVVEGNTFLGPFNATAAARRAAIFGGNGTVGAVIRGNRIYGTGTEAGLSLTGETLQSSLVTGNVVQGASFGLLLQQSNAAIFGARVFRNDITGSTVRAVGVLGTYTLLTELSWDGAGNYWGHSTPPCFNSSDTPIPGLIQDSHPFCAPVAAPE
jgi:nitrous oxidase accessory protein NosD